ncbi:hydrogen peroxide-dependent heme synthase [uncultured Microbacterium sp.]|uniref:hydrogen peroxide-dependent heme synthase n=1 Tax=uncultured Microbacterium sp. TaxID=191216 RepID=UPI0035CA15E0
MAPEPDAPDTASSYTLWAVFRRDPQHPVIEPDETEVAAITDLIEEGGVIVRGFYDVSGLRADADLMIWLHGPDAEGLQRDLRRLRRTELLRPLIPVWNAMGVHRDAEFTRSHVPGFLRGIAPKRWLCVYPFVRSYEWYLLPEEERRRMLAEHGRKGAAFTGVTANTVASFALGDYEWILPLEADDLTDLVDMMRDLRYTDARRHVREEVPFYTGRRIDPHEIPEVLQ